MNCPVKWTTLPLFPTRSLGLRDWVRDAVHEPRARAGTPVRLRDGLHVLPQRRDLPHVRHPRHHLLRHHHEGKIYCLTLNLDGQAVLFHHYFTIISPLFHHYFTISPWRTTSSATSHQSRRRRSSTPSRCSAGNDEEWWHHLSNQTMPRWVTHRMIVVRN